ncbi:uncharacterized protein LOC128952476 [Oppia nitens]|uniref:uncharacterized protein LOC128952476 n=1 Tax=Oppia nitens TaxID=1686743 RepID=UPI0023D9ECDA|nr:uncharacterized protein LOC128952476 [Oppia nitens]
MIDLSSTPLPTIMSDKLVDITTDDSDIDEDIDNFSDTKSSSSSMSSTEGCYEAAAAETKSRLPLTSRIGMNIDADTARRNYELQLATLHDRIERMVRKLTQLKLDLQRRGYRLYDAPPMLAGPTSVTKSAIVKSFFPFIDCSGPQDWVDKRNVLLIEYLVLRQELVVNRKISRNEY